MKIMILCGHGKDGANYDPGACGCGHTEATETIRYGNLIANYLRKYATVDVYEGNMYHRLFFGGKPYDFTPYDYVLECHLNAAANASGHGTEIFVTTLEKEITVEQAIMKRLSKHFTLRDNDAVFDGVKRYNWGVIHAIKSQDKVSSALLELCFITNRADMSTYENKLNEICKDIAEGIAEGFKLSASGNTVKVPAKAPTAKPTNTSNAAPKPTNKIAQEAAKLGLKVGNKDTVKKGFFISENATIYGGASYGVKVPTSIKKATTYYTCGGVRYDRGEWWVLANQIMSWVKVSETLVKKQ